MKSRLLYLIMLLVCSETVHGREDEVDFTISTSEFNMSFKKIAQTHNVGLSGDSDNDEGQVWYDYAVTVKTGNFPYNLVIPQTVVNEDNGESYSVVEIGQGAFGNGSRTTGGGITRVDYEPMPSASEIYSLTLPSTVYTINSMLPNIKILKCCRTTPPALNKAIPSSCTVIYVPQSSLTAYKTAEGWLEYSDRIIGYSTNSGLITNISLPSKSYEIYIGSTIQLTPTVTPSSSSSNITWSSSDPSIATVNSSGLVTSVSTGTCYITVTSSDGGYVFSTVKLTVSPLPPITNITLNETEETLFLGDFHNTITLTATISPTESTNVGVTWSSSNTGVATVSQSGIVTAVSEGNAIITCTANDDSGTTATCQIIVKDLSPIRIGTGTNNSYLAPFHSSQKNNEVFLKYKSGEIGGAGIIYAISFDENWGNGTLSRVPVEIWMGKNDAANFYNNTSPSGNEKLSQMTRVFQQQITIEPNNSASKRQRYIILETPFEYDGTYDLNIFIAAGFYLSGISTNLKYDYTSTSDNTVKYRGFTDSVTPSSWTWTNSKNRPNIRLWFDDISKTMVNSDISISSIDPVTYNGSAQTPTVTVKDGNTTLTEGTDYTLSYSNNINAGTATVTVTGMGNYSGTKTVNFTINPKNASSLTISSIVPVTYNGSAQTPTVTVKDGNTTLTEGTGYTVAYSNNTNAGTATVAITGMGNYTGTKNASFTINPKNASNLTINSIAAQTYTGAAKTPTVTVKDGSTTLSNGTDYTTSYSNNINAGTATVTITGIGNYTGTKNANFTINKVALTITAKSYTINQMDDLPEFEVTYSGFVNAETSSVLTTQPTITCDAADSETAGVFDITPSGAAATNYSFNYVNGTLTINEVPSVSIAVNSLGKGTYCSKYPLDFTNVSGIEAYIVSGFKPSAGNLIVTRAYEVPAGTGLYIVGTPGNTYNVPVEPTDFYYSNMMKGVTVATVIPANEDGYTNYVLSSDGHGGVIFKHANDTSSPANRAYVQIPSSIVGAREFLGIETDDDSTSLDGVFTPDTKEAEGDYYNLSGQKVQNLKRGIYIRNGKIIFIH